MTTPITLVFDLDETLAQMAPMFFFVDSLRQYAFEQPAYSAFVEQLLDAEKSANPLGLLRPGLLALFEAIEKQQQEGRVEQVILYSNNGHLKSLELIRDLLHRHVQRNDLIRACIHWYHPYRAAEKRNHTADTQKTWEGLNDCLVAEGLARLNPAVTYFYDDLEHADMRTKLGDHYHRVEPYQEHADPRRVAKMYETALLSAELSPYQINRLLDKFEQQYRTSDLEDIDDWIRYMIQRAVMDVRESLQDRVGNMTVQPIELPSVLQQGGSRKRKARHRTYKRSHALSQNHNNE